MAGGGEDQHRAEREDVTRAGDAAGVLGLLGRHVGGGADGDVRHRQTCVRNAGRDTEVDDPGAVLDDQDVRRLEVAVHQSGAVDRLQRLRDARRQPAHRLGRHRPALVHYLFERGRGDVRGGQPRHGRTRVGVDHGRRVEAGDRPGRLHLTGEADAEELVLGELRPDRLDRHAPARKPSARDRPAPCRRHPAVPAPRTARSAADRAASADPPLCLPPPRTAAPSTYVRDPVQRLTTAPPWRHAP